MKTSIKKLSWDENAVLIAQEIREWSANWLELASDTFNGVPPCPFAKRAWQSQRVMIHVSSDIQAVNELKAFHPPTEDLVHIVAWTDWNNMSVTDFDAWINEHNKNHFGVWIAGIHPEHPTLDINYHLPAESTGGSPVSPEEHKTQDKLAAIPEGEELITMGDDYAVIIVQEYKHLVEMSQLLAKATDYYKAYHYDDLVELKKRQDEYYVWKEKTASSTESQEDYSQEKKALH